MSRAQLERWPTAKLLCPEHRRRLARLDAARSEIRVGRPGARQRFLEALASVMEFET